MMPVPAPPARPLVAIANDPRYGMPAHDQKEARATSHNLAHALARASAYGERVVTVATDGSWHPAYGGGSYAFVSDENRFGFGPVAHAKGPLATEIYAMYRALTGHKGRRLRILTDSEHAIRIIRDRQWDLLDRRTEARGLVWPLIAALDAERIELVWVPGHRGVDLNEKADRLARTARLGMLWGTPRAALDQMATSIVRESGDLSPHVFPSPLKGAIT